MPVAERTLWLKTIDELVKEENKNNPSSDKPDPDKSPPQVFMTQREKRQQAMIRGQMMDSIGKGQT